MKSLGEKDVSGKKPGKLPEADYKKGTYLYVGRARTGLRAKILEKKNRI